MASETFDTRASLRARLRARMGFSTDDLVNVQNTNQLNEYLREGAKMTRDATEWKRLETEDYFNTGVAQRFYNYPANTASGDIVRLSYWDADSQVYVPLKKRMILPILDTDPALAGDDLVAREGSPQLWEERSQLVGGVAVPALELWPLPDAIYSIKREYKEGGAELTDDVTPCTTDALAILLYAFAEWLDHTEEDKRADKQRAKWTARVRWLAGSQRVGATIVKGQADLVRLRYGRTGFREPPNIDTSLSVMP